MIILAIVACLTAIAMLCWLLFTLAVFAMPTFVGFAAGGWALESDAGVVGAILIGILAAVATSAAGHLLLASTRSLWLKGVVAGAFVVPAAMAGFHATHGVVKHLMPSEAWQLTFSAVGAVAVAITAFARIAGMTMPLTASGRHLRETGRPSA